MRQEVPEDSLDGWVAHAPENLLGSVSPRPSVRHLPCDATAGEREAAGLRTGRAHEQVAGSVLSGPSGRGRSGRYTVYRRRREQAAADVSPRRRKELRRSRS
jgi:hypothetical protein